MRRAIILTPAEFDAIPQRLAESLAHQIATGPWRYEILEKGTGEPISDKALVNWMRAMMTTGFDRVFEEEEQAADA